MQTLILAAQDGAAASGQNGMGSFLIMMVLLFVIMYFFMIRPQQKRQKEIRNFQNSLAEGSQVVTGGGVHGTVKRINMEDNTVELEIAKGVTIKVDRNYVFQSPATAQTPQK